VVFVCTPAFWPSDRPPEMRVIGEGRYRKHPTPKASAARPMPALHVPSMPAGRRLSPRSDRLAASKAQ